MSRPHLRWLGRRAHEGAPEVSITPLIDVVFLLLIFFLCTLRFRAIEGRLDLSLPLDRGGMATSAALPAEPVRILLRAPSGASAAFPVSLQRRGAKQPMGSVTAISSPRTAHEECVLATDPPDTFVRFEAWLRELRAAGQAPRAQIEVEGAVAHAVVVAVLNDLVGAGFKDVSFAPARAGR
jgi:biopolymer transport protein ExbD